MAERVVSWRAIANFSAITREAKKAELALESLRKKQHQVNAQSGTSAARTATTSAAPTINRQQISGLGQQAAAQDKVTAAVQRNAEALAKNVAANRASDAANRDATRTSSAVAKASAQVVAAHRAQSDVNDRLALATLRLAETNKKANTSASSRLSAEQAVTRAFRDQEAAASRVASAQAALAEAQRKHREETQGFTAQVTVLKGALGGSTGGILNLGVALKALLLPLAASAVQALTGALSACAAAAVGLAGAIAPAVGLIGTIPGIAAAAAGGIGTLVAGFAGIGGALKAYGQQQKNSQKTAASAAKTDRAAARTTVSNARAVRNAKEGVAAAQQQAGDSARNSARSIVQAERSVTDAQYNAQQAQKAVSQARKDARQNIEDLRKSLRDLVLQEEGASQGLEEAKKRLVQVTNDPGSTDLDRREAATAVKQAQASLDDVHNQQKTNAKDLKAAQKKGVEGSDQVVQAKHAEAQANQAVSDAEQQLADARRESGRAAAASAKQIRDAKEALSDARQTVSDTAADTVDAAKATDVFKESLKGLTPEAVAVVKQLISMKPLLDQIRATAQRGLMPGVLSFLQNSTRLFPGLIVFVRTTSRAFGNFFERIGKAVTSSAGLRVFNQILGASSTIISTALGAFYNVGAALVNITRAAIPLTKWLADSVSGWTASWKSMTSGEAGQRRLTTFFTKTKSVAKELGRILANTIGILVGLGKGTSNVGKVMFDALDRITRGWATFINSVKGQDALRAWGRGAMPIMKQIGLLIGDVGKAIARIGQQRGLADLFALIRSSLLPAVTDLLLAFSGNSLSNLTDTVHLFTNLAQVVGTLANSGVLGAVQKLLLLVSDALAGISHMSGAAGVFTTLFGVILGWKAVSGIVTFLGGVAEGLDTLQKVTDAFGGSNVSSFLGKFRDGLKTGRLELGRFSMGMKTAVLGMGFVGIALTVGAALFARYAQKQAATKERVDQLTQSLRENGGVLDENTKKQQIATLGEDGYFKAAQKLHISIETATKAYYGNAEAQKVVNDAIAKQRASVAGLDPQLRAAQNRQDGMGDAAQLLSDKIHQGASDMADASDAAKALAAADDAAGVSTGDLSDKTGTFSEESIKAKEAQDKVTTALLAANDAYQAQIDLINAVNEAQLNALDSSRAVQKSRADLKALAKDVKSGKKKGGTSATSEQGRSNYEALSGFATNARDNAIKQMQAGADPKKVQANLEKSKKAFLEYAASIHAGKKETDALVKSQFGVLPVVRSTAEVSTEQAQAAIKTYKDSIAALPPVIQTLAKVKDDTPAGLANAQARLKEFADTPRSVQVVMEAQNDTKKGLENVDHALATWKELTKDQRKLVIKAGLELDLTTMTPEQIVAAAQAAIEGHKQRKKAITNSEKGQAVNPAVGGLTRPGLAEGGEVHGPGTTTSDSIPTLLSDQEFVHNAKAVDYYGTGIMHALNQRKIDRSVFAQGRFARGGLVARSNRLKGGGQAVKTPGASIFVKAGVDFSGLPDAASQAAALLAPVSAVLNSIARSVGNIGSRIGGAIGAVGKFAGALSAVFGPAYGVMVRPFNAAAKAISARISAISARVNAGISLTTTAIRTQWTNVVGGLMVNGFKPVPAAIGKIMSQTRAIIEDWVNKIGSAWSALKGKAAEPISYIIDTVLNGGLIAAYNAVANNLGLKSIGNVEKPKGLATGGVVQKMGLQSAAVGGRIHGGPNRGHGTADKVLGVDRLSGMPTSLVSPGEFVVPEKQTKKFFPLLERMRRGTLDAHAGGGTVRDLPVYKAGGLLPDKATRAKFDSSNPSKPTPDQLAGASASGINIPGLPTNLKKVMKAGPGTAKPGEEGEGASAGSALAYAASKVGSMNWYRLCLRFVNLAWGSTIGRFRKATAQQSALAGPTTMKGVPPAGAAVYWLGGSGHVALADGGGNVYSNDIVRSGRIDKVPQKRIDNSWHKPYHGWWSPTGANAGSGTLADGGAVTLVDYFKKFTDKAAPAVANLKNAVFDSPFGQLASTAGQKVYDSMAAKVKSANDKQSAGSGVGPSGGGGSNRAIGHRMMLAAGFPESNWGPLERLWTRESSWNEHAKNPSSGAYGIPQSLPGTKMASAGSDWRDNPATQIKWGLGYIKGRYKNPAGAWAHSQNVGWYARGTNSARQGPAVVGENGPEIVHMRGGERVVNNALTRQRLPRYNTGGVVNGFQPDVKRGAVSAIRSYLHMGDSQTWDKGLSTALTKLLGDKNATWPSEPKSSLSTKVLDRLVAWIKKQKKASTLHAAGSAVGADPTVLWREDKDVQAYLKKKKVPKAKQSLWTKTVKAFSSTESGWRKDLEKVLGAKQDGKWPDSEAVQHLIAHGMKWKVGTHGHTPYANAPWASADDQAIYASEKAQARSNTLNKEFDSLVSLFDSWNLPALVRKMNDLGVADGLTAGRPFAAKDKNGKYTKKNAASDYNNLLQEEYDRADASGSGTGGATSASQIAAIVKAVTAGAGLTAAATAAGVSIDTAAALYGQMSSLPKWTAIPQDKRARFEGEVSRFKNLFKFATGGRVPGEGNGDRVHVLAEPGEFIVRRAAVASLTRQYGPEVLGAINNADRFANGGYVAQAIRTPAFSATSSSVGVQRTGSGSTEAARSVVNNFNTVVNNPTLEDGAISVQKRVTRVARLGLLNA